MAKDNLTKEEKLIIAQKKKIKQLEMENDILKQAALIFGRKVRVIGANKHSIQLQKFADI